MSKEKETPTPETQETPEVVEEPVEDTPQEPADEEANAETAETESAPADEVDTLKATIAAQEDKFLRLCAEYDNFRRRSQKEKEGIYQDAKADTVKALLPVYDNLERALKTETADEAYKQGVEMTMTGLKKAFESLGVTEIDAIGQPFDPNVHNAVMHIEDDSLGENVVAEVFQAGFTLGDKVIRFAMVKVAN